LSGFTFDTGALIALERNDRRVLQILGRAAECGLRITVPATALAQAMRSPARQSRLSRLVNDGQTDVIPLDTADATAVGRLLDWTRTADIVDAHVVICAQRAGQLVVTSDADDLRRLAPAVPLVVL
jgi:predicted nucleic acid-binding protein